MCNKRKKEYICKVCGRETTNADGLCDKHSEQYKKYKCFLDDNPRDERDVNEIKTLENIAHITLYDSFQEEKDEVVIIDREDVDKIKNIRWDKKQSCIVANILGKNILLPNYILDTDDKIEYANGNFLDCRKENLIKIEPRKKRKKKVYNISKKNKNKIIVEFIGHSQNQVTGSAIMVSYPISDQKYKRILVEMGQSQTNKDLYTEFLANKEVVENVVNFNEIDACFICHSHL